MKFWNTAPYSVDTRGFLHHSSLKIDVPPSSQMKPFLCVRSIWAAILQCDPLHQGAEVILSAVNIPHMSQLVGACGLNPRYAEIQSDTLLPTIESLERVRTDKTRFVLIAHLFGCWSPISHIVAWAHAHNLIVVEDCAQCYLGRDFFGSPEADFSMFSFGIVKRRTAGAGAILIARNQPFFSKIETLLRTWPIQSQKDYLKKIRKVALFASITHTLPFSAAIATLKALGKKPDHVFREALRGYPNAKLPERFHERPHRTLENRLHASWSSSRYKDWQSRSDQTWKSLPESIPRQHIPGHGAEIHSFWLLPILFRKPEDAIRHSRTKGGYAVSGVSSLQAFTNDADRILKMAVFFPIQSSSKKPNPFPIGNDFAKFL